MLCSAGQMSKAYEFYVVQEPRVTFTEAQHCYPEFNRHGLPHMQDLLTHGKLTLPTPSVIAGS